MRECAFCGNKKLLSKEHVWSSCLLEKRQGNRRYSSNAVPDKFIGPNALQIKDVCEKCNSENLSELDDYFCRLYDLHIKKIIRPNDEISFEYDFSLLSRWLLKTLYNNARSGNAETKFKKLLGNYSQYILSGNSKPSEYFVFLQLIIPYVHNNNELAPNLMTAGPMQIPGFERDDVETFMVCIDSFRFIVVIPRASTTAVDSNEIIQTIPDLPATNQAAYLNSSEDKKMIKASDVDARYTVIPTMLPDFDKWVKLFISK
ncbi:hypothetical protein NC796_25780 [Aliifodinibius sp. S!AR15-10]|uniref:hypothetical protein n=1 Tax=Aliifodinibius sp. S!AR15-10 TaxID=2950437 RepID=UPI00285BB8AD|nr:hypothetical protein [Aliifodinibius sp. S!AR15-10]MDR8394582.1 hypothetical protein [Aliifodinibius sp. S!AR15-10]